MAWVEPTDSGSTGKGQKIMQGYFEVLNNFNDQKITCEILDKADEKGLAIGTKVIISIPIDFRYVF